METAYAVYERLGPNPTLLKDFVERDELRQLIFHEKPMDEARLRMLMGDGTLLAWRVLEHGQHTGYLFVRYDSWTPPLWALYLYRGAPEVDMLMDAGEHVVRGFFQLSDEPVLVYFVHDPERNVPDELHEALTEAGWVVEEDYTEEGDPWVCYALDRETYDAYYGEGGEDDEFEAFDDDY